MSNAALKVVNNISLQDLNQHIRAERFNPESFAAEVTARINDTKVHIKNISESGAAIYIDSQLEKGSNTNLSLEINGEAVYQGEAQVAWCEKQEDKYFAGLAFVNGFLSHNQMKALEVLSVAGSQIFQEMNHFYDLDEDYKKLVYEIKHFLTFTKSKLDHIDALIEVESFQTKESYDKALHLILGPKAIGQLVEYNRKLDSILSHLAPGPKRKHMVNFFKAELSDLYNLGAFVNRAKTKPLGYSGDYEMMNQIYENKPVGKTLFSKLMHLYGINEVSSQSVKYRRNYLKNNIKELSKGKEHFVSCSVACGPAKEVQDFLNEVAPEDSHRYTFVFADQDFDALYNAKRNISNIIFQRGLKCTTHFIPVSVKDILEQSGLYEQFSQFNYDFIYTAGLYDYLTQPVAKALTETIMHNIKDAGMMIIGNFHPNNPTKTISELCTDWTLIHRTEADMNDLVHSNVKSKKLHWDSEEVDLFLEIIK